MPLLVRRVILPEPVVRRVNRVPIVDPPGSYVGPDLLQVAAPHELPAQVDPLGVPLGSPPPFSAAGCPLSPQRLAHRLARRVGMVPAIVEQVLHRVVVQHPAVGGVGGVRLEDDHLAGGALDVLGEDLQLIHALCRSRQQLVPRRDELLGALFIQKARVLPPGVVG